MTARAPSRFATVVALSTATAMSAVPAAAQKYPERPIRLIVPFIVGGSYDPVARVVSQYLSEEFAKFMREDIELYRRIGREANIGVD